MSTVSVTNLKNAASASNNLVLDTSGNTTAAGTVAMGSSYLRNRIINGDMRIDQRNAGASVSITSAANTYFVDRWRANANGGGVFSVQRSTTAPTGFTNSILATVTTADSSVTSGDFYHIRQGIEGFNFSDLGFGAAGAAAITISFWVRSSVTGTYVVMLRNSAGSRGYVTTYSVNSANTWEYKSISIPGDTSGTWPTDNSESAIVSFNLGSGNTQTANSWQSSASEGVTGQTQWISTNGATFYITGVQLEVGTVATPFERRLYGAELMLCQRYYEKSDGQNTSLFWSGNTTSGNPYYFPVKYMVVKRANPTTTISDISNSSFPNTITVGQESTVGFRADATSNLTASGSYFRANWASSAEL